MRWSKSHAEATWGKKLEAFPTHKSTVKQLHGGDTAHESWKQLRKTKQKKKRWKTHYKGRSDDLLKTGYKQKQPVMTSIRHPEGWIKYSTLLVWLKAKADL